MAGCTTGQWLAAWLAGRQSLRPLTRRSYQHHLDTYLLPCIGNIPLAMLTAADLRVMFTAIARQRPAAGGPLSPATLARIRATLRAALNAAIREGLISVQEVQNDRSGAARMIRSMSKVSVQNGGSRVLIMKAGGYVL